MIHPTTKDLAALKALLPKNDPRYPVKTLMEAHRQGNGAVKAYPVALRMAEAIFAAQRKLTGKSYSPTAVSNFTRFHLADLVSLHNWLEAQALSPALYLLAQVMTLKRALQPRGLKTEKALQRYADWFAREGRKSYFAQDTLVRLETMEPKVYRLSVDGALQDFAAGRNYVLTVRERTGLSDEAIICLEAWHLPAAYLAGTPQAVCLCENGALDDKTRQRIRSFASDLSCSGQLSSFLSRTI